MTKRSQKKEEMIDDEDFSSEDIMVYKPKDGLKEELEVEEEAYKMLEHVELEWPSLSVDSFDSKVVVGTSPTDGLSKPELITIEIQDTDFEKMKYQNLYISHSPNKIRTYRDYLFALSDTHLIRYSSYDKTTVEATGNYGFGMCITPLYVIVGRSDGFVEVFDHGLIMKYKFKASNSSVECVGFENDIIITGSTDHTVKTFSISGELIETISNDSDINALDVRNSILIFGDDNGKIHKVDLKTKEKTVIEWHHTPISFVRWRDNEIFATGSEEQVCIWDLSLTDEEQSNKDERSKILNTNEVESESKDNANDDLKDFPTSLLFVHQGQRNYKDVCFNEKKVITTSEDGLCVFEPISFFTN
jgi:ribosome assembly protein RRB1